MPLSRLSPRSNRKGLKARGKNRYQKRSDQPSGRHLRLWEAIRRTRDELENWQALSNYIEHLFRNLVLPREQRLTKTVSRLSMSLITLLEIENQAPAERSLIGLWIIHNIETLQNHPFADESDYHMLLNKLDGVLDNASAIDSQLIKLLQRHRSGGSDTNKHHGGTIETSDQFGQNAQQDDEEDSEELLFDFGWHKKDSPEDTDTSKTSSADTEPQESIASDTEDFIDSNELDEKIKKSQKSLSVDRLFRQLAKVLHPDRELDETLKAEKHLLMSQCLEARQKNDVDTLLQLYCEYVGDLPDGLNNDSQQELITALELQLKLLQRDLRLQRFGDALLSQIVERYSDSSNAKIDAKIASHAKELDKQIRQREAEIDRLSTEDGLKAALIDRRSIELDRMTIDEITGNF